MSIEEAIPLARLGKVDHHATACVDDVSIVGRRDDGSGFQGFIGELLYDDVNLLVGVHGCRSMDPVDAADLLLLPGAARSVGVQRIRAPWSGVRSRTVAVNAHLSTRALWKLFLLRR